MAQQILTPPGSELRHVATGDVWRVDMHCQHAVTCAILQVMTLPGNPPTTKAWPLAALEVACFVPVIRLSTLTPEATAYFADEETLLWGEVERGWYGGEGGEDRGALFYAHLHRARRISIGEAFRRFGLGGGRYHIQRPLCGGEG
jgi:hypothetical protein